MPAPIAWEPCAQGTEIDVPCTREVSLAPSTRTHVFGAALDVSASGAAVAVFGRRCPGWDFILLSELQGRVLTAIAMRRSADARRVQVREVVQGHWLAVTRGNGMHTILGGEIGLGLPKRIETLRDESDTITAYASGEYIAVQKRELLRWSGERMAAPWDGHVVPEPTLWGQYAFFNRWHGALQTGMIWDALQGERPLLGFAGTKVGRVVTDGTDLAFVGTSSKGEFLAASPFHGSSQGLSVHKLATFKRSPGTPVVGCGLVAVRTNDRQAMVVRIRDGQTWTVTSREKCSLWCIEPIGLSCQEMIAESYGSPWTMLRIPLDALGAGTATVPVPMRLLQELSHAVQ
jgi:hypothetical protein